MRFYYENLKGEKEILSDHFSQKELVIIRALMELSENDKNEEITETISKIQYKIDIKTRKMNDNKKFEIRQSIWE